MQIVTIIADRSASDVMSQVGGADGVITTMDPPADIITENQNVRTEIAGVSDDVHVVSEHLEIHEIQDMDHPQTFYSAIM